MSEAVSCMTCLVLRGDYGPNYEIGTHVDPEGVVHHTSRDSFERNKGHVLCLIARPVPYRPFLVRGRPEGALVRPLLTRVEIDGVTHERNPNEGAVTLCRVVFACEVEPSLWPGWAMGRLRPETDLVDCMTCLTRQGKFTR